MSGSPEQEQEEDRRGEGKGSGRDDDDDPADGFEDSSNSTTVGEAQTTINQIDQIVQDESNQGRYGLASNREVLENAFTEAEETTDLRDEGIEVGDTTADSQLILRMDDGSRVFATPTSVYSKRPYATPAKEIAIANNENAPKVINALGGNACKTAIIEDSDGDTYIAREGVDGEMVSDRVDFDESLDDSLTEESEKTLAAAYFTGNPDLNSANVMITEDGEVSIIDHDRGSYGGRDATNVRDISTFTDMGYLPDDANVKQEIYQTAIQIRSGEQEIPLDEESERYQYAQDAADKAVRSACVDDTYDVPESQTPSELQSTPNGRETLSDFSVGEEITIVDSSGDIVERRVENVSTSGEVESVTLANADGTGSIQLTDKNTLNRIVEIQ